MAIGNIFPLQRQIVSIPPMRSPQIAPVNHFKSDWIALSDRRNLYFFLRWVFLMFFRVELRRDIKGQTTTVGVVRRDNPFEGRSLW